MASVHLDADGTYTVSAGDSTDTYSTLREALDAALPTVATHEKQARLRNPDTSELNGQWRWLPATDVEPVAIGGVRIDAQAIREMADSLNARPGPIPVDGGPTPSGMLASDVHGTATTGGGTPANGWAHWGVVVEGPTAEQAKLYLYAELVPEVAREVDAGRIATGSVHFGAAELEGELPRGVELISHALTNDPAVKTLAPANSVRTPHLFHRSINSGVALRARAFSQEIHRMAKNQNAKMSLRAKWTALGVKGPAADKLAEIARALGIDPTVEMESEQYESPIVKALCDLKNAANVEKILEGAPAAAASTQASGSQRSEVRAAVAGLADEAAKDGFVTAVIASLVKAGIAKEGDDAATALAALDAWKPAGAAGDPGQMASAEAAKREDRADLAGLRSALETERAERAKDREKIAALEQRETRRTVEAQVAAALTASRRVMSDADRKVVVDDLIAEPDETRRARNLARACGAAAPTVEVMGGTSPTGEGAAAFEKAVESLMDEARKSLRAHAPLDAVRAKARVLARKRFPDLAATAAES